MTHRCTHGAQEPICPPAKADPRPYAHDFGCACHGIKECDPRPWGRSGVHVRAIEGGCPSFSEPWRRFDPPQPLRGPW